MWRHYLTTVFNDAMRSFVDINSIRGAHASFNLLGLSRNQNLLIHLPVQCIAGDATVRLTIKQQLPFGESLRIAGSGDPLGNWDPASAPSEPPCSLSIAFTRGAPLLT